MKYWSVLFVIVSVFLVGSQQANACIALGHPSVKIKLGDEGQGVAVISEYDCSPMVAKTQCIAAIRLADVPGADRVRINSLRFINLDDHSTVEGFDPQPNGLTSKAFAKFLGGDWAGFAATYNAKLNKRGGTAMEVEFSYDPTISAKEITKAFDRGHVGIGEGTAAGRIAPKGHHIEVIEIRGAQVSSY